MSVRQRVTDVEARSAGLRKELGVVSLVLTQVMYVVGSGWVGTAAKLGPSHVVFWCLAILLFYLPQAAVVIYLNRQMPIEGGLYQWASAGLGKFLGFLTAWNLWAYTVLIMATFGVMIATNLAYLIAPMGATFTTASWYTLAVSTSAIVVLTGLSIFGLRVGKWLQNIGGTAQFLMFAALIIVPYVALTRGTAEAYHPLDTELPTLSWFSLNIFGKMALGALSGFEYVAILAGECRNPARTIGRSVLFAVPVIAVMFIFGTSSVLALVPRDQIDLVSPIPQALTTGFQGLGVARLIVPALIIVLLCRQIGNVSLIFAGNTRLPMVAGWDGLLPAWFTRLHPRFRTPVNSILFVGALTLALTLAGQIGVGVQEAFQLLENAAGILYAFTYMSLFAIPLFGGRRLGVTPPLWLRLASASGLAVSVLYSVLSVFPIIDVASWKVFAAKIIAVLVAVNLVGLWIYWMGVRRTRPAMRQWGLPLPPWGLSMQPTVYRALEFDRVREALAREALTPLGRARAEVLTPATSPEEVQRLLDLTSQAFAFEERDGSLGIDAPDNLAAACAALDVEERPLEPLQLLGLARFLDSVEAVSSAVMRTAQSGPLLRAIAARATSFEAETTAIRRAIQASGDLNDDASPALREIREKLRRQRAKLRTTLESFTRGRDAAKYLQDQIVTDRNGRYVLVVRAEHGQAIPGIVHGSSASGASLYLEPLSTVELNNEIVTLAEREVEEVRRILLALSRAFRLRADDVATTLDVAADLDELHAKSRLARKVDGRAPELVADGRLEFRGARHPLLIPAIRDLLDDEPQARSAGTVVASDLLVLPPTRALVISGPNTGGKTVALKAMGLLALMAQAGLLIPVDAGSKMTPFRSVFADIGDEQSISASLSTFSAHIANLVAMNDALELPALVLLDEVGGGTDPVEGGALGTAVIEHFRQRGATVVATTHDDALKSYAATTDGVMTAGFGFNPETYAPTYRIVYGAPGRSLALEIAERLGMPASVVAAARARRSGREAQLAAHLARMDRELAALEAERRLVEDSRRALAQRTTELAAKESQVAEREAALRRRTDEKLNERLREAREQIDAVVADLKVKAAALADQAERRVGQATGVRGGASREMLTTGEVGGLRAQARAALGTVGHALELPDQPSAADGALQAPPAIGQTVFVASFGVDGIVRGISGKDVDVEVRGKRMRVPLAGLKKPTKDAGHGPRPKGPSGHTTTPTPHAARELMLIGVRVEEAIERSEKLLDAAILADERRLRIVHGHGTGRLRDGLRAFFREHPLVATVTTAPEHEGGDGATIVELKD